MLIAPRVRVLVALCSLAGAACEPPTPGAAAPAGGRPLPSYTGRAAELFDDVIEPRAVGLDLDQVTTPKTDPRFRERAQVADVIVRARVSTVTGKVEGTETSYQVAFDVVETLAGRHALGNQLIVRFDRSSPSIGVMRSFDGRLVGKTMIVLARAFVRADGDDEIHIHAAADSKDVLAAVKEAVILNEMGGAATPRSTTNVNRP